MSLKKKSAEGVSPLTRNGDEIWERHRSFHSLSNRRWGHRPAEPCQAPGTSHRLFTLMAPRWISHKTQDHEPRHAYVFPHLIPRKTNTSIYSCMHANILKILQWSSLNKSSSEKEDARRQYIPKLAARQMFADPEPYFVSTTFKRKNFHQYKDTSAGAEPASCLAACVEMQRLSLTH